jgi:hypothetical protein
MRQEKSEPEYKFLCPMLPLIYKHRFAVSKGYKIDYARTRLILLAPNLIRSFIANG